MTNETTNPDPQEVKYLSAAYGPLVGARIVRFSVGVQQEGRWTEYWPTLTVRLPNGREMDLEVSADDEGNGPGALFFNGIGLSPASWSLIAEGDSRPEPGDRPDDGPDPGS